MTDIGVVVGELLAPAWRSPRRSPGAAVADVDAVKPGKGIEELLAVPVFDEDALTASDDPVRQPRRGHVAGEVGRGMEEVFAIPLIELVVAEHRICPLFEG